MATATLLGLGTLSAAGFDPAALLAAVVVGAFYARAIWAATDQPERARGLLHSADLDERVVWSCGLYAWGAFVAVAALGAGELMVRSADRSVADAGLSVALVCGAAFLGPFFAAPVGLFGGLLSRWVGGALHAARVRPTLTAGPGVAAAVGATVGFAGLAMTIALAAGGHVAVAGGAAAVSVAGGVAAAAGRRARWRLMRWDGPLPEGLARVPRSSFEHALAGVLPLHDGVSDAPGQVLVRLEGRGGGAYRRGDLRVPLALVDAPPGTPGVTPGSEPA